jgi:uncharacterized membrane protein (DUF2068 family)
METRSGVRAIIVYKLAKTLVALAVGTVLLACHFAGVRERIHPLERFVRQHMASRWSLSAARILASDAAPERIRDAGLALVFDGALSSLEGRALYAGVAWGPWLVMLASGLPLPFELAWIVGRPRAGRIIAAAANLLVIVHLARCARMKGNDRPTSSAR